MHTRITSAVDLADRISIGTVKTVDAKVASLPTPTGQRQHRSFRAQLKSALDPNRVDEATPLQALKQLRLASNASFAKSKAALDEADETADLLAELHKFLTGETHTIANSFPEHIKLACHSIQAARMAGLSTDPSLAAEVKRAVSTGRNEIKRLRLVLERRKHAFDIGFSKQASAKLAQISDSGSVSDYYAKLYERSAHRYAVMEKRAMARSKAAQNEFNNFVRGLDR
jgi:hypothetical protein